MYGFFSKLTAGERESVVGNGQVVVLTRQVLPQKLVGLMVTEAENGFRGLLFSGERSVVPLLSIKMVSDKKRRRGRVSAGRR